MELLKSFIDLFLHLDEHLNAVIQTFGVWSYFILFLIIFLETGVVIMPFLPGDSLIFAAGTLAAFGSLNIWGLYVTLLLAAIVGDTVNYWIGHAIGPRVFAKENSMFFKKEYLVKTQQFYEKHGGKTIILARFIPIIRTFAPFVAGVGKMDYKYFLTYNIVGGFVWVTLFVWLGYFFGNIPFIQHNFHYAVVGIIALSIIPIFYEFIKHKRESKVKKTEDTDYTEITKTFEKQHISE